MRSYECVFIARQDVSVAQVDAMTHELMAVITDAGGKIHKREYWGLKSLAYRIKKNRRGHYVLLDMEAAAEAVAEFDRKLGLNEDIIRTLIMKTDAPNPQPSLMMRHKSDRAAAAADRGEAKASGEETADA